MAAMASGTEQSRTPCLGIRCHDCRRIPQFASFLSEILPARSRWRDIVQRLHYKSSREVIGLLQQMISSTPDKQSVGRNRCTFLLQLDNER